MTVMIGSKEWLEDNARKVATYQEKGAVGVHSMGSAIKSINDFHMCRSDGFGVEATICAGKRLVESSASGKGFDIDRPNNAWNNTPRPKGI